MYGGILALLFLAVIEVEVQQAVSVKHFESWETWPTYVPRELPIQNSPLTAVHIAFDGLFPGTNGLGILPLDTLTMFISTHETCFRGKEAMWIRWTSQPQAQSEGAPALDALVVDRSTFGVQFRVAVSEHGAWAGRYEIIHARPDAVVQVTVNEAGTTATHRLDMEPSFFEFAAYPLLFARLDLEQHSTLRLQSYDFFQKAAEVLAVKVVGRIRMVDATRQVHEGLHSQKLQRFASALSYRLRNPAPTGHLCR